MMLKPLMLSLSALTLAAACDQISLDSAPEVETPPVDTAAQQTDESDEIAEVERDQVNFEVAKRAESPVDWETARDAFAQRGDLDSETVSTAGSGTAPPVPVLLPQQSVTAQSSGQDQISFAPLSDGYFAVVPGEIYDLVINGTNQVITTSDGSVTEAPDTPLRYEETMTGAQVSFVKYGASYLVEFMCKDPATPAKGSCVTEEEGLAAVEQLLISGTR